MAGVAILIEEFITQFFCIPYVGPIFVASALVGVGLITQSIVKKIAPNANAYYYAVNTENRTQVYHAIAIKKVCELHKKLIAEGKNGIDVIHIQRAISLDLFSAEEGYEDAMREFEGKSTHGRMRRY